MRKPQPQQPRIDYNTHRLNRKESHIREKDPVQYFHFMTQYEDGSHGYEELLTIPYKSKSEAFREIQLLCKEKNLRIPVSGILHKWEMR